MREQTSLAVRAIAAATDAGDQDCVAWFVEEDAGADAVDRADAFVLVVWSVVFLRRIRTGRRNGMHTPIVTPSLQVGTWP